METVPATTGDDGKPTLQQLIVPPGIFQKMQKIQMTEGQEKRLEGIKERKFSELKSAITKTTERRLKRK
jgi:predicted DNA-binding antitoxin AbrB/MazE fold protein